MLSMAPAAATMARKLSAKCQCRRAVRLGRRAHGMMGWWRLRASVPLAPKHLGSRCAAANCGRAGYRVKHTQLYVCVVCNGRALSLYSMH